MFHTDIDLDALTALGNNSLPGLLGMEFIEITEDSLRARMPVDERTHQPFGILHGGASAALAETIGSVASACCIDLSKQQAVGLELNANHVRGVRSGYVYGTAKPLHIGRRTHIWDIRIVDEQDRLVCVSRLTMMITDL